MLVCAQSGWVSGLEKKTDPASSSRSDKKGLKDNNNRLLGIVNKFCITFGTKRKILLCWGLDSDCTVVILHRTANLPFALRILVGLARAIRRQIGNTGLGGCNRRPFEKNTDFKFCLFGAAPDKEGSFLRNKVRLLHCD